MATQGKLLEDLKNKLAYEWKNIYRGLAQADVEKRGTVSLHSFNKVAFTHRVYLSKEELKRIELLFGPSLMHT
jgi:hypothetical protein